MKTRLLTVVFSVLILCIAVSPAASEDISISLSGLRTYWFGFTPTGLDLTLAYTGLQLTEGVETILETTIGGGYEESSLYRDIDGSPYTGTNANGEASYMQPNGQLEAGIIQGMVWNDELDKNLLSIFSFYRTRFETTLDDQEKNQLVFDTTTFTDRQGLFGNSLLSGILYDDMSANKVHRTAKGILAEASVEWAPAFVLNEIMGETAFTRLSADATFFYPLFDADSSADSSVFSVYLGNYTGIDYAMGASIPIYVSQSFGGTFPLRDGLGKSVRGFEDKSYDTVFKAVNNFEIRINGPSIIWPKLVPGFIAYLDAGYYAGYDQDPDMTEGGFLLSAGAGVNMWIFGLEYLGFFIDVPLVGERIDGNSWKISIPFGLHF